LNMINNFLSSYGLCEFPFALSRAKAKFITQKICNA